ncbi:hypothetical protein BJV74DRAFT_890280 [Russula compacta]|nr:hypothetical protein BJV74DRAFT_890280 [Russula compacta]
MFPTEFKVWYGPDHKCAHKGYPGLPAWLPDDLFACFGLLPHNPENIHPADPAGIPTTDTRNNEEGLSPQHIAQVVFAKVWPSTVATSSSHPTTSPPTSAAKEGPPTPSSLPNPIPVPPPCQPIIIPQEKTIDLTMLDDEDGQSYHVHSPSADPSVQEIVAPGADDSDPGSNWEEYSI